MEMGARYRKRRQGSMAPRRSGEPAIPDNFKGVCSGASVSTATAYDKGRDPQGSVFPNRKMISPPVQLAAA